MLKILLIICLLFSGDVFAQRAKSKSKKSNKRSASAASKVKSSGGKKKSSKRSASAASKMGGAKVRGSRKRQASASTRANTLSSDTLSDLSVDENQLTISSSNGIVSSDIEELKKLILENTNSISNIQSKMTLLDEIETIKSKLAALEEFKSTFSLNTNNTSSASAVSTTNGTSTTTSSSTATKEKEGYIKGSTELCQGKDYCSVALNTKVGGHEGGDKCLNFYFDDVKGWRFSQDLTGFTTNSGEKIALYDWINDKPDLFVMKDKDLSRYVYDSSGNNLKTGKANKNIVLCGKGFGLGMESVMNILDSEISYIPPKLFSEKTTIFRPFTSFNGDMILFRKGDEKPVLRYNYQKDLLEYLPQMTDEELSKLFYVVNNYDYPEGKVIKTQESLKLRQGRYEVEIAGAGGSASGNCFANWGQSGGNGGYLKTTFDLEAEGLVVFDPGKAGSAGAKNCGAASKSTDSSVILPNRVEYVAKAGGSGSGKHGLKKNVKASDGSCSISQGCTVGGGAKGGGLGAALKAGKKGADGWIKIRGIPLKINVLGKPID